jgi:hypothetical protein
MSGNVERTASRAGTVTARATLEAAHRGFRISIAASRRITGVIIATASLSGGPSRLLRNFAFQSESADVIAACEDVLGDLRAVIDDMLDALPTVDAARGWAP